MIGRGYGLPRVRFVVVVGLLVGLLVPIVGYSVNAVGARQVVQGILEVADGQVGDSCSIFTVTFGDTVLYGNNEDYLLEGTYLWVVPAQEITTPDDTFMAHGFIGLGFNYHDSPADGIQGAMNDQGLCVDANGLPRLSMNPHPERDPVFPNIYFLNPDAPKGIMQAVLFECGTVSEVITWFQTHDCGTVWVCQFHFADATGDAVVVSVYDGELNFTRINSEHFLVSTNFNLANHSNGHYPCTRYTTATNMLSAITSEEDLSVEACRDVLDAVHNSGTKYSNIFDPVNRQIFLYQNHNYEDRVSLDLELALFKKSLVITRKSVSQTSSLPRLSHKS
jgi:choloylglycine hydrolase